MKEGTQMEEGKKEEDEKKDEDSTVTGAVEMQSHNGQR